MAINFPIVTTFDDKATKKADKAFGSLGRKFAAVFSVAAVVKFGKASVKAFQDGEKEAAQLRSQLEAINLGFASPLVNEYIDNLALLSGITGRDLTNAFISLSQATEDTTDAQDLLNVALDISAATGKSLQTVSVGLQRAYKGEVTALARLRIGLTTAELKGKDFNEVLEELRERFTGSSARAADTFAGKIARLKEAVDLAQEAFGKGLVSGIESSGQSIEDLQEDIIELGETLGSLTAGVNNFASDTIAAFDRIGDSSAVQGLLNIFEALVRGVGFVITGELVPTMDATTARLAVEERRKNEVANRATLRLRNELVRAEQKITKNKKEQEKLTDKEKKNALALAKSKSVFDLEKIQIEAALKGKITEEERIRLQLMKAITNENATAAEDLVKKLKEVQEENAKIVKQLTTFPKANDPFVDWAKSLDGVTSQLTAIAQKKIVVDFLANFTPTSTAAITGVTSPSVSAAAAGGLTSPSLTAAAAIAAEAAGDAAVAVAKAGEAIAAAAEASEAAAVAVATAVTAEEKAAANAAVIAAEAATDASTILTESAAAVESIAAAAAVIEAETILIASENLANILDAEAATVEATTALTDAAAVLSESFSVLSSLGIMDFNFAGLDFTSLFIPDYTPPIEITVNVAGSVTTENDLAQTVYDTLLNYQKSGIDVIFQQQAI